MSTVFIGGSRHVSRLPPEVKERLGKMVESGHSIIVGDANGADKAVQRYFLDRRYADVTVFCSGTTPRNNLGSWPTHSVGVPKNAKGFSYFAAKDREMAKRADIGFMIWDGKSPGTALNVLRLVRAGRISVLFNVPEKAVSNIKSLEQWWMFVEHCNLQLRSDIRERATPEEWFGEPPNIEGPGMLLPLDQTAKQPNTSARLSREEIASLLNEAFAAGDTTAVVDTIGSIVRDRRIEGMPNVNQENAPRDNNDTDFARIMKVISSIGLRLEAKPLPEAKQALAPNSHYRRKR